MLELVRGREDFQVLQAVPGFAEKGALDPAEQFLGRLGAVLVQRLGPPAGDPSQEVGVVFDGRHCQGMFHGGGGLGEAAVPDPVQGERDEGCGPGRDLAGRDGGGELLPDRWPGMAAAAGAGQQLGGQRQPALCLGGADPQPRPQKICGVPVAVIRRSGHPHLPGQVTAGASSGPGLRPADRYAVSPGVGNGISSPAGPCIRPAVGFLFPAREPARLGRFLTPAVCGRRGERGLLARPLYRGHGNELEVFDRAGQVLDVAGKVRGLPQAKPGGVDIRSRARSPQRRQRRVHRRTRGGQAGMPGGHSRAGPRGPVRDELSNGFHN